MHSWTSQESDRPVATFQQLHPSMWKATCSLLDGSTLNDKTYCQLKSRYFLHIILFPYLQFRGGHEPIFLIALWSILRVYTCNIFCKRGKHWSEQVSVETNLKQVIILPNTKSAVVKTLTFWTCWGQFLILGSLDNVIFCVFFCVWLCKYLRQLIFFQNNLVKIFLF